MEYFCSRSVTSLQAVLVDRIGMSTVDRTVSFISLLALYNSDEVIVLSMTEYVTNNHGKSSQVNCFI